MKCQFHIVRISLTDLHELKIISRKTYTETFTKWNTPENMIAYLNSAFSDNTLTKELKEPGSEFYFAKLDDEIIGYLKVNFDIAQTEFKEPKAMEIERFYIAEAFQGKKYGQQLMDLAFDMAQKQNKSYIWLGVWENNTKAIQFYTKNGFSVFGSHPFIMGDDIQTDLLMKRKLDN